MSGHNIILFCFLAPVLWSFWIQTPGATSYAHVSFCWHIFVLKIRSSLIDIVNCGNCSTMVIVVTAPQCHSVLWMVSVRETNMGRWAEHKFLEHVQQLAYLLFYRDLNVTPRTPCYIGIYTSFGIERCIVFRTPVTQWPMSCVTRNPTVVDASTCLPYKLCNCDGATRLLIDNLHHLAF